MTQASIKFRKKKNSSKNMVTSISITQTIHIKMATNVYECGRGVKCLYMFRYTYAAIRIINMQIEKEDRHMSRVMRITRALCLRYVLNSQEKKKKNKNVVMNE